MGLDIFCVRLKKIQIYSDTNLRSWVILVDAYIIFPKMLQILQRSSQGSLMSSRQTQMYHIYLIYLCLNGFQILLISYLSIILVALSYLDSQELLSIQFFQLAQIYYRFGQSPPQIYSDPNLKSWVILVTTSVLLPMMFQNWHQVVPRRLFGSQYKADGWCVRNQQSFIQGLGSSNLLTLKYHISSFSFES